MTRLASIWLSFSLALLTELWWYSILVLLHHRLASCGQICASMLMLGQDGACQTSGQGCVKVHLSLLLYVQRACTSEIEVKLKNRV